MNTNCLYIYLFFNFIQLNKTIYSPIIYQEHKTTKTTVKLMENMKNNSLIKKEQIQLYFWDSKNFYNFLNGSKNENNINSTNIITNINNKTKTSLFSNLTYPPHRYEFLKIVLKHFSFVV